MKNLRKTLSILLLSFIVFSLIPRVAFALGKEAVATVNLNFRDKGTVYSNVIGVIPAGESLTVLQTSGNWSEVTYGEQTGWVSSRYLADQVVTERTITNLSETNLKAEPTAEAKTLAVLAKRSSATVLETIKDWYKVDVNGKVGYVFAAKWIDTPVTQPVVAETAVPTEGTFEVFQDIMVYMTALDARSVKNSVGTYPAGEYHIYKNYSGMVNITRHAGVPGAWINPVENQDSGVVAEKPVKTPQPAPVTEPTQTKPAVTQTTVTTTEAAAVAVPEKLKVVTALDTYVNAYDAKNDVNRVGRLVAGEYIVYKTFGGMVNLTKEALVPGSWIDPSKNVEAAADPVSQEEAPTVTEPVKTAAPEADQLAENQSDDTVVSTAIVNVRESATNYSQVLRTLPKGTSAVMVGRESNWLKIDYEGQIGYSYINYWTVSESTLAKYPSNPTQPKPDQPEVTEPVKSSGKLKVYLDPGHNGAGLGAVSNVTGEVVDEATINFKVAILAKAILEDRGYDVYLSKSDLSESSTLAQRTAKANELGVDIFVSIHGNSYSNPAAKGTIGFYAGEKTNPETSDWQAKSMLLSRTLAESVGRIFGSGKIVKDTSYGTSFAVNRLSTMPSVLLELGFISNYDDARIMNAAAGQQEIALEIANGIDKYFGK